MPGTTKTNSPEGEKLVYDPVSIMSATKLRLPPQAVVDLNSHATPVTIHQGSPSVLIPGASNQKVNTTKKANASITDTIHQLNRHSTSSPYTLSGSKGKEKKLPRSILLPTSTIRQCWDFLVASFVIYNAWKVPFVLCFPAVGYESGSWYYFDFFLDIFFMLDIVVNFRTAFIKNGNTLVVDWKEIAIHYLRGWLFIDVVASVPFEKFFPEDQGLTKVQRSGIKLSKFIKMSKLLRLGRVVRYLRNYFKYRHLMLYSFMVVLWVHISACILFLLETTVESSRVVMLEDGVKTVWDLYLSCLAEIFMMLHGVSVPLYYINGTDFSIHPTSLEEAGQLEGLAPLLPVYRPRSGGLDAFYIIMSLSSMLLLSVMTAIFVVILSSFDSAHAKFRRKMDFVSDEMDRLNISGELKTRVRAYYDYLWINKKSHVYGAHSMYRDPDLSLSLKHDLTKELVLDAFPLRKVEVLSQCSSECLVAIMLLMKTNVFMPGEYICHQYEEGHELYYLSKGIVALTTGEEPNLKPCIPPFLYEGCFFGEVALVTNSLRTANVRAVTCVELTVLGRADVELVFQDYPEYQTLMQELALRRLHEALKNKQIDDDEDAEEVMQELQHAASQPASHQNIPGYMPESEAPAGSPAMSTTSHGKHDAFNQDANNTEDDQRKKEYTQIRKSSLVSGVKKEYTQMRRSSYPAPASIGRAKEQDATERNKLPQIGSKVENLLHSFEITDGIWKTQIESRIDSMDGTLNAVKEKSDAVLTLLQKLVPVENQVQEINVHRPRSGMRRPFVQLPGPHRRRTDSPADALTFNNKSHTGNFVIDQVLLPNSMHLRVPHRQPKSRSY